MREKGFTIVELLAAIAIVAALITVAAGAGWKVYASASLAVSTNNIRQLTAGAAGYLADNNYVFWPYKKRDASGTTWWYGFEPRSSESRPEGERTFDPELGPLGGFVAKNIRPDLSITLSGGTFKPKYRNGYIGIAYNVLVGGGYYGTSTPMRFWELSDPSRVVVFCTAAQVNDFQAPASPTRPMLEEIYGLDEGNGRQAAYPSVHFRHNGKALVSFADGNAGFLEMDPATRDNRLPTANIGRFAPAGSTLYLK